jgi:putative adenylate-forming enzyme
VTPRTALALAYLRTRALHRWLSSRDRVARWQTANLERLRRDAIADIAFYRELGDVPLSDFPIVGKADVMARFEAFNRLGLTASQLWAMVDRGAAPKGYDIGCSTGTSGNRGLYLISDSERFVWLGTIVAKALPISLRQRHRVAIVLPRSSRLYETANESKILKLLFVDLNEGLASAAESLAAFKPTVLVGPPKALRWFAENGTAISPGLMFSSAEVLDPPDRELIERHFKLRLRQIYMATEGLFAVSCDHGTLHLAEDVVHFEFEQVADDADLVTPIVTDFRRRTQIMARYRMNDILRLDRKPCPCGSALQAVSEIVGRCDDAFELPNLDTSKPLVLLTPDVLRNAVLAADRSIDDFRIRQVERNRVDIVLPVHVSRAAGEAARERVLQACMRAKTAPELTVDYAVLPPRTESKLRRVENCWKSRAP